MASIRLVAEHRKAVIAYLSRMNDRANNGADRFAGQVD
jgi:hypothetical protein